MKAQRMIERRQYLHDVHSRLNDSGWHRSEEGPAEFWLALVVGLIVTTALAIMARL